MTDTERIDFELMKEQLKAALLRIATLEASVALSAEDGGGEGGGEGESLTTRDYVDLDTDYPVKPFTIERDDTSSTDGSYKMYVPDGCVLYDGETVSVSGKGSDDWLDLGTTEGVTYYLHVTESNGTKSASIDTSSSSSGSLVTVRVATIATDDESSQQFLFSAINFGGSGSDGADPDEVSVDLNGDDELQVLDWATKATESSPIAVRMIGTQADGGSLPYRPSGNGDLQYVGIGTVASASDSDVGFTANAAGTGITVGVYYV